MNKDGKWENPGALQPQFKYELENGIIKKVSFEIDYTGNEENLHYLDEVTCAALAWEGGKWKNPLMLMISGRITTLEDQMRELGCGIYEIGDSMMQDIVEIYGYEVIDFIHRIMTKTEGFI